MRDDRPAEHRTRHRGDQSGEKGAFSLKGLLVGTTLCIALGVLAPYGMLFQFYLIGNNSSSVGALFFFFVLTLLVSVLVRLLGRHLSLSRADLVLVYCMLLMAVTMPTWGLCFFLIGTIIYPYYYATPENRFAELFHHLIPSWMTPQDMRAIKDYYEGLPRGAPVPWGAWVEPLAYWFAFILALGLMLIALSAILHRQWSVHERLAYPMAQLPQRMIEGTRGTDSSARPFLSNWLVWLGFALPMVLFSLTGLHEFNPAVPEFQFYWERLWLFRHSVWLPMVVSFAWVGFFYLVSLEVTFSVWFFYLLCKLEEGVFQMLGVASTEKLSLYEYSQPSDLTHQGAGAVIVFILFGLWTARGHLRDVVAKAWNPSGGVDDSEELLSYRTAVGAFAASFLFVSFWLWRSGVPVLVVPILMIISLIFFILVARVVATAGIATARSPIVPAYFIISGFGTSILGAKGLVALGFTFIWHGEARMSPLVACANGLKLAEMIRGPKTVLFWGLMIAMAATLGVAVVTTLKLSYTHGAVNLWMLGNSGGHGWPYIAPTMLAMPEANMRGWLFTAIGGAVEGLLVWAQHRLFWWPLHPLGFAIGVGFLTGQIWLCALVTWILKLAVLHFGGGSLFQRLKPFFLGLILGEVCVGGVWGVIFVLTSEKGRMLTNM